MKFLTRFSVFTSVLLTGSLSGYVQTGIIKGKVLVIEGVLQAATVFLGNENQLTDYQGGFVFSVRPGIYTLVITHTGYKKIEQKVEIEEGNTQVVDFTMTPTEHLGEVVVLGSRSNVQRSNLNMAVPVDALSAKQLTQTGQLSLVQMLNFIAPSFTASRQVSNEPATLRGLDPEHVLILLNGTRYHNSAWLNLGNFRGSLGRGSVGNDLNSIPFSAIEKIEILRDGASAQYGSDAIAGAINIRLKELTGKTSIQINAGQYYKGDGENLVIGINRGISLRRRSKTPENENGFLNISGDYRFQGRTNRGGIHEGTVYSSIPGTASQAQRDIIVTEDNRRINSNGFSRLVPASHVGNPKLTSFGFLINGGYPVKNHVKLFWTAAINNRIVNSRSAYVFPKTPNQIDTALFPGGFQPRINTSTIDVSGIAGIKGKTKSDWHWELSTSYGYNSARNHAENTNNASLSHLVIDPPTFFYTGSLAYQQMTNNVSVVKTFDNAPFRLKWLSMAFGAEWRLENHYTSPGEEASWKNYDTIKKIKTGGSQGLLGINTNDVVNENRNVAAIYIDLESELSDQFLLNIAGRYEHYSDYGGNIAGKLAARYKFSEKFSLRGSLSNGFRAPSLQQRFYRSTLAAWDRTATPTVLVTRGIFSENHPVTNALNNPDLTAENTINMSVGFTARIFKPITITVDAYQIQIKNRIILSGIFDRTIPIIDTLLSSNPTLNGIDQVQFFTNAINTKTQGIDIVVNGKWNIQNNCSFGFTLAANFNKTHVFGDIKTSDKIPPDALNTTTLFNIEERTRLEKGQPGSKIILSMIYKKGKTEVVVSNTRFGSTATATIYTGPQRILTEKYSSKILTNISINYSLKTWMTITLGANNIFNVYPDHLQHYDNKRDGILIYSQEASPFGYNGGYYFVTMVYNF